MPEPERTKSDPDTPKKTGHGDTRRARAVRYRTSAGKNEAKAAWLRAEADRLETEYAAEVGA